MAYLVNVPSPPDALKQTMIEIEKASQEGLKGAVRVVKSKVMDLTPRHKGGLVAGIKDQVQDREGKVYGTGVVMRVMEDNPHAKWSKWPPHKPILDWVESKLGLSGKDAERATFGIRRKIFNSGMTIPNQEGRGAMFQRTFSLMKSSKFHMVAYISAIRQLQRR